MFAKRCSDSPSDVVAYEGRDVLKVSRTSYGSWDIRMQLLNVDSKIPLLV